MAAVDPKVGGKYELFWNPEDRENDSTISCKGILAVAEAGFSVLSEGTARELDQMIST